MPTLEPSALASELPAAVHARLKTATGPLKLADLAKGLSRPKKVKVAEFLEDVRKILDEEVRLGRAFSYPSAKGSAVRYWAKDEKQLLRDKAVELAAMPQPLSALKTALGKEVLGTDGAFVEVIVRELIGDDRLFEYPPKSRTSKPLFGATPPPPAPPPLEQEKHKKTVDKLAADCRKLLAAAGVGEEELFRVLRSRLGGSASVSPAQTSLPETHPTPAIVAEKNGQPRSDVPELDALILKSVELAPVVSLAELRREMPVEFRGRDFDEAVLRLAERQSIIVSQDADPSRFSAAELAELVEDRGNVFTTIMKRS